MMQILVDNINMSVLTAGKISWQYANIFEQNWYCFYGFMLLAFT